MLEKGKTLVGLEIKSSTRRTNTAFCSRYHVMRIFPHAGSRISQDGGRVMKNRCKAGPPRFAGPASTKRQRGEPTGDKKLIVIDQFRKKGYHVDT